MHVSVETTIDIFPFLQVFFSNLLTHVFSTSKGKNEVLTIQIRSESSESETLLSMLLQQFPEKKSRVTACHQREGFRFLKSSIFPGAQQEKRGEDISL